MSGDQAVPPPTSALRSSLAGLPPLATVFGVLSLLKGHTVPVVVGALLIIAGLVGATAILVSTHRDDAALANEHRLTKRALLGMMLGAVAGFIVYLLLTRLAG